MSEKKIILICLSLLFILSTIFINLKAGKANINNTQVNASNSEINIKPKIEIEISK